LAALLALLDPAWSCPYGLEISDLSYFATVRRYTEGNYEIEDDEIDVSLEVASELLKWTQGIVVIIERLEEIRTVQKNLCIKGGSLAFPIDFLVIDESTYSKKSEIGGVYFDAKHEGRVLFQSQRRSGR
jgi:hypothetical protein